MAEPPPRDIALAEAHRLGALGQWEAVESSLDIAVARDPGDAELWFALGQARYHLTRANAPDAFEKSCALQPSSPAGHFMLGTSLLRARRPREAIAPLREAVSLAPQFPKAALHLGVACAQEGCWASAARAMEVALAADSNERQAIEILATARQRLAEPTASLVAIAEELDAKAHREEAEEICAMIIARDPRNYRALWLLGKNAIARADWPDTIGYLSQVRATDDVGGTARLNLAAAHHNLWDLDSSCGALRSVIETERDPGRRSLALERYVFSAAFERGVGRAEINRYSEERIRLLRTAIPAPVRPRAKPRAGRRLKIGYFWNMFGYPIDLPFIAHHDRSRYMLHAYAFGDRKQTDTPDNIGRFDHYRRIGDLSDEDAAKVIADDEIDILVDIGGQGAHQRNEIIERRPAPIQIGYGNKMFSTMSDRVDWLIGNPGTFLPEDAPFFVERLHVLPATFVQSADAISLAPVPAPCITSSVVTIGSPASLYKVNEDGLDFWCRILERVPDAFLSLSFLFGAPQTLARIHSFLAQRGIPPTRYRVEGHRSDGFLAYLNTLDLALDATPFSANFSASQAIAQGVPLVSISGERYASRLAAGLLGAIGRSEWVAHDIASAAEIGIALAQDRTRLARERTILPELLQQKGLLDAGAYARAMEAAYETIFAAEAS